MIRLVPLFLWLTLALTSVGCSGTSKIDLGAILTSGRDGWQHPERVVESLDIRPGDSVAEIGAGSGYWLAWLSEAVGPDGRVYAVEVDPELVRALEERVAASSGHWSDPEAIVSEMNAAVYASSGSFDFVPAQSFQVFAPRPSAAKLTSTAVSAGERADF